MNVADDGINPTPFGYDLETTTPDADTPHATRPVSHIDATEERTRAFIVQSKASP